MSKELLKRALDEMSSAYQKDDYYQLVSDIEEYLAKPDPEPVAWMRPNAYEWIEDMQFRFDNSHPDYSVPVYTEQPDQSARIAELEAALTMCRDVMLHFGVHTDKEHPDRLALVAAENSLAGR